MTASVKMIGSEAECRACSSGIVEIFMLALVGDDGEERGFIGEDGEHLAFPTNEKANDWMAENVGKLADVLPAGVGIQVKKLTVAIGKPS